MSHVPRRRIVGVEFILIVYSFSLKISFNLCVGEWGRLNDVVVVVRTDEGQIELTT